MSQFLIKFSENLDIISSSPLTNTFSQQKTVPRDVVIFLKHLNIIIPYFCRHPYRIIEEIDSLKETGLQATIQDLHRLTQNNAKVWRGTIGEAIATAYILARTDYKIPIFKLRFASNRKQAMHGDDVLGFQFNNDGTPKTLLVTEVKNYKTPGKAVRDASQGLLNTQNTSPTLLDFIINILQEKDRCKDARLVKRFLNAYVYPYETHYHAFVVAEESRWKDSYFDKVGEEFAKPLTVNAFLISSWELEQANLIVQDNQEPTKLSLPQIEVNELQDVRSLLTHPIFQNEQNQLASEALAIDLNIKHRANYRYDQYKLEQAAHYLSISGLNLLEEEPNEVENVLKEAAIIHERLATLRLENHAIQKAYENILESALLYSIAGYSANAKVLVEKLLHQTDIIEVLLQSPPKLFLTYLLTGQISNLQNALATFFQQFKSQVLSDEQCQGLTDDEQIDLIAEKVSNIGDWLTAKMFATFTQYLRTGNEQYLKRICQLAHSAAQQYATNSDYSSYILINLLKKYFYSLSNSSTHKLVCDALGKVDEKWKLYLRFLSTLGRFPMLTLWKSQRKAIEEGLLEEHSLVISMPTSAGKTKTAELAIYRALKDNPDRICVYVVPTRALACEVEDSLSKSLSRVDICVSILYGGYNFSYLEEDVIKDNQVFVLTPEKLDLLIRSNEKFKQKLALIIIDEVHDSASASPRSLSAELIYSRLLYIAEKNQIRVICISAVINNPNDFAQWISGDEGKVTKIEWRPTRQRLALFNWFKTGTTRKAQVRYLPQPDNYPSDDFFVPLSFTDKILRLRNKNGKFSSKNVAVAARLARHYVETGSTLVFTTTKPLVEEITDCLITLLALEPLALNPDRNQLADVCTSILGVDHRLSKAIKLGFCYHHGDLPANVRKLVEKGVRDNIISLIVSTTTLSQGVNLPIKNVIVHSLTQRNIISMSQYANVVGRAGRAGCETEGHIIFCEAEDLARVQREASTEKSESFITSGIKLLVESRLISLETTDDFLDKWALASTNQFRKSNKPYQEWTKQMKTRASKSKEIIFSILDAQLLAWLLETCVDEVNEAEIQRVLNRLLCNVQALDFEGELESFKQAIKSKIIAIRNRLPNPSKRKLFNLTGLSVASNEIITLYAQHLSKNIKNYLTIDEVTVQFWQEAYDIFKQVPELSENLKKENMNVLVDWIQGKDYQFLAETYFAGKAEVVVSQIEKVSYSFSWGLNSVVRHLHFYLNNEALPNVFKNLSSFVIHGVPDVGAVYAISLGVFDRQIAIALSKEYQAHHATINYSQFKAWLFKLGIEQWMVLFPKDSIQQFNIEECFQSIQSRKISLESASKDFTLFFSDEIEISQLDSYEEFIIVNYNDKLWLTTYDYANFWELSGQNIEQLKQLHCNMYDLVITEFKTNPNAVQVRVY
jgi:replicative superfamily II helicase